MKALITVLTAGLLLAGFAPEDAQARRLGGARSFGVQRPVPPQAQKVAPAPQQGAQQAAPGNRWLGPLAGLAAGLGLGWLLSQGGFGGLLAAALVALLAGFAVFALLRLFARPRAQPALVQYAGLGRETVATPPPSPVSAAVAQAPAAQSGIPAGFDSEAFLRQAKLNFIRLQEANDRHDLDSLREVTTDQMYDAIIADLAPGNPAQHTDVVNLNASLLELATEGDKHWASVRFHGTLREEDGEAAPFEEVWHLQKPLSGRSGWLLAGIQQVS